MLLWRDFPCPHVLAACWLEILPPDRLRAIAMNLHGHIFCPPGAAGQNLPHKLCAVLRTLSIQCTPGLSASNLGTCGTTGVQSKWACQLSSHRALGRSYGRPAPYRPIALLLMSLMGWIVRDVWHLLICCTWGRHETTHCSILR